MNKLFGLFLLALAFLTPASANAASCFWVGGTGNINDTTHWSSASGGTVSTCAASGGWPNSTADTGTFDASSGGGTITRNVSWTIGTLNIAAFTGTFGNSGDTSAVNFNTFTNNGSGTRSFNMGASTWTCGIQGTSACTWNQNTATNLTFAANTSTLVLDGSTSSAQSTFSPGAFTYNVITFNPDAQGNRGWSGPNGNSTIGTLNIASPNTFKMVNGSNTSVTTLNFTGGSPSVSAWVTFVTAAANNIYTLTLTNPATCNYCIIQAMTVATSSLTANNSVNLGQNTNVSVTPPSPPGGGGGRIIGG